MSRSPGRHGLEPESPHVGPEQDADRHLMHTVEFDLVDGDTMVLVDLPSMPKDARKQADCDNIAYRSRSFRVHSDKLLATGSANFARMLGPQSQSRTRRRRKMLSGLPQGVHYVLDLTPPSEGDELVFQMTELSLTPAIGAWWTSHSFHGVDHRLVTGHDDVCTCRRQKDGHQESRDMDSTTRSQTIPPTPEQLMQMKTDRDDAIYQSPPFRRIPDYCPIRHRNAIVRLMMLIQGRHVSFDSASRVWTLVALANIMDCTSVVRNRVSQWIMHGSNSRFIEVLPEEALRIGFAIKNVQITQCAFRILVNELAIHEAADERTLTRTTVFGRRRGDCGDDLNNIIQHAARALIERVSATRVQLQSPDLLQVWKIQEWDKLQRLERLLATSPSSVFHTALEKLRRFMRSLPEAVASKLTECALHTEHSHQVLREMDADRATYVQPTDFERLECIMTRLNFIQKLMCPFVWNHLGECCGLPIYLAPRLAGESTGGPRFASMLREVEESLRAIILAEPAAARAYEWTEFLESGQMPAGTCGPTIKSPLIDLDRVDWQVQDALLPLALSWVRHDIDPPLNLTRHLLLTLTIDEMKFLPLWAGGFDDGTGGVFETFVPSTDMGPSGPGPAYHTGRTLHSSAPSLSDTLVDDFSVIQLKEDTAHASVDARDGVSMSYRLGGASSPGDTSKATVSFTTFGSDYQEARAAMPADQVPRGREAMSMGESHSGWDEQQSVVSLVTDSSGAAMDEFEFAGDLGPQLGNLSDSEGSMVIV